MKTAYKMADGRKVEGRRVIVDVERGRTVPNWWEIHTGHSVVVKPTQWFTQRACWACRMSLHACAPIHRASPFNFGLETGHLDFGGAKPASRMRKVSEACPVCAGGRGAWEAARAGRAGSRERPKAARAGPQSCLGCPARPRAAPRPRAWRRCRHHLHPQSGLGAHPLSLCICLYHTGVWVM